MRIFNVEIHYDERSLLEPLFGELKVIAKVIVTTDCGEKINVNKMIDEYNAMKKLIKELNEECK